MRFSILFFLMSAATASAQAPGCIAMPTKVPIPFDSASQSPNRAALIFAFNSPDLVARRQLFAQKKAKLDSDLSLQAQRTKQQQLIAVAVSSSDFQKRRQRMADQVAAVQGSSDFQNQKTRFLANLKCSGQ